MNLKEAKDMIFLFVLGFGLQYGGIGRLETVIVLIVAGTLALLVGIKREADKACSSWMVIRLYFLHF